MPRQNFDKRTRAQIVKRATIDGQIVCEGCELILGHKPWEIDHTIPEGLVSEKRKLTAEDGKLLGKACCHKPKTKQDVRQMRKADRQGKRHYGVTDYGGKIKSQGFAKSGKKRAIPLKTLPPRQLFQPKGI